MQTNLQTDSPWETTTKRYVGYIDIMGFKDLVARESHDEIYQLMKNINLKKQINETVKWRGLNSNLVKTTNYSDSIMIYSKDDSKGSLYDFICTIAGLTDDLFCEGVPHKGAIAYGMMTLDTDNSIFFGQPLIDAYLLQDEIFLYGIIIHATAEKNVEIQNHPFIIKYLCPLKNGQATHLMVEPINARLTDMTNHTGNHEKLFLSISNLRYKTSGYLRKYIDNTETFMNYIKGNDV